MIPIQTVSIMKIDNSLQLENSIKNYCISQKGGFEVDDINYPQRNFCSIFKNEKATTFTYPRSCVESHHISKSLSVTLKTKIYNFSEYNDGWAIDIFENGRHIISYNPSIELTNSADNSWDINTWNQELKLLCKTFSISLKSINKYFLNWKTVDLNTKAYKKDEFCYGNAEQIYDIIRNFSITYSDIINYEKAGKSYQLWTSNFPLEIQKKITFEDIVNTKRYTKYTLPLLPSEIETILGINYEQFIFHSSHDQWCPHCKSSNMEKTNLEFHLDINQLSIATTGNCKNCHSLLESNWGILQLDKLKLVLDN